MTRVSGDEAIENCGMEIDDLSLHKSRILDDVANSDSFFKSQQRGEKDLTFNEKRRIAEDLLEKNVALFLQRYWKFVNVENLAFFDGCRDNYEINFYLEEINKQQNTKTSKARIQNRRYEAMKGMVNEGSYFTDEEMRQRNPLLHEQLVGQYMTEDEKQASRGKIDNSAGFSSFLMDCIEKRGVANLMKRQEEEEEAAFEEEDDEEEEDEDENCKSDVEELEPIRTGTTLTESEKQILKSEFTNTMYESFLAGKDKNFDYSTVDDNAEYDSVQQREIDEEEKYFDSSESLE